MITLTTIIIVALIIPLLDKIRKWKSIFISKMTGASKAAEPESESPKPLKFIQAFKFSNLAPPIKGLSSKLS